MTDDTLVVDASTLVNALLLGAPPPQFNHATLHAPSLIDYEVVQTTRRLVRSGVIDADEGSRAIDDLRSASLIRHPAEAVLELMWSLRGQLSAYDASYVALAVALGAPLITADTKLARVARRWCDVSEG